MVCRKNVCKVRGAANRLALPVRLCTDGATDYASALCVLASRPSPALPDCYCSVFVDRRSRGCVSAISSELFLPVFHILLMAGAVGIRQCDPHSGIRSVTVLCRVCADSRGCLNVISSSRLYYFSFFL